MPTLSRLDWPEYFIGLAHLVAKRSTCDRKHVGCVIVTEKRIVSSGYNGSVPGMPHCDEVGHDLVEAMGSDGVLRPNCVRTIHAEANAITQAAYFGSSLKGASLYVNTFPCWPCFRLIVASGIEEVYYDDEYRNDERVQKCAEGKNIKLIGPKAWRAGEPV